MIQNGGFETGNLSGWDCIGDVSVQTASFRTQPKQGNYQALLTTFHSIYGGQQPWEPALPLSGNDPVGYTDIELFLGLPDHFLGVLSKYRSEGGIHAVTAGSAIRQQFTARAGSLLIVQYNFLTDGGWSNANDFSFVSLVSPAAGEAPGAGPAGPGVLLGFVISGVESPDRPSNTVLAKETGYRKFTLAIPFTGTYTLGIGVMEMHDTYQGSAICVDNVAVIRRPFFAFNLRKNELSVINYTYLKRDLKYIHPEPPEDAGRPKLR